MSSVPKNLKYTKTHEWVLSDNDQATIGITEYAQALLGDLVFVDLPEVGNRVCAGDDIGVVESVKAAADFYTPISGVIVAVNPKACQDPSLVNKEPYGSGWLVKIKPDSLSELEALLDAEAYAKKIAEDE